MLLCVGSRTHGLGYACTEYRLATQQEGIIGAEWLRSLPRPSYQREGALRQHHRPRRWLGKSATRVARRGLFVAPSVGAPLAGGSALLNVSYDPTGELYQDINKAFAASWKQEAGREIKVRQSHGGSGKRARFVGDVVLAWENEALLAKESLGKDDYEIVLPSVSILAEPPVAVVDAVARRKGTTEVAEAYLQYLYAPEAQEVIAKHYYRPSDPAVLAKHAEQFPNLKLFTIEEKFGSWKEAQTRFFNEGGVFDQLLAGGR